MVTRGFFGRRSSSDTAKRIPPGQHEEIDFPVLSAGPTPRVSLSDWKFSLRSGVRPVKQWTWEEFNTLPRTAMTTDIHCVTTWTKLNTQWEGVLIDDILKFKRLDGVEGVLKALAEAVFGGRKQHDQPGAKLGAKHPPALVIWGKEDQIIPAAHAGKLPGAKVHVIDNAGHMVFMEKASDVNALIKAHIAGH